MSETAFEILKENPFESSGAVEVETQVSHPDGTTAPEVNLEYCEFCKGYYIMEYHFGDTS